MNTVWEVQPKPGRGVWGFVRDRFLSLSMVMGVAFLLLVSLVVSAVLAAAGGLLGDVQTGVVGQVITTAIDLVAITLMFALIFRYLPDAEIARRDVWLGAGVTAALFVAGSLAVLLVWPYYAAQIFLFGAEPTKAHANRYGSTIKPKPPAERATAETRAQEGLSPKPTGAPA